MYASLVASATIGSGVAAMVSLGLVVSFQSFAMAACCCGCIWILSVLIVMRLWRTYCCSHVQQLPAHHDDNDRDDRDDDAEYTETAAMNRDMQSLSHSPQTIDSTFIMTLVACAASWCLCGVFLKLLPAEEDDSGTVGYLYVAPFIGMLLACVVLIVCLQMWSSGVLSCGCCPMYVAVPTYLLPRSVTVALSVSFGSLGFMCGCVVAMFCFSRGLSWTGTHATFVALVGVAVGGIVGVLFWLYLQFIFLPHFRASCSPLQRDAYFASAEAVKHNENLDGIGNDEL